MNVDDIFSQLISHMRLGLEIHNDFAAIYGFLNLRGYQRCQEYHYYEENQSYRDLQNFYTCQYGKIANIEILPRRDIIPSSWYKYEKTDVDISTRRNGIENVVRKWLEWEQETKHLLISNYKLLYDNEELIAANRIMKLIEDVDEEIQFIKNHQLNLAAIDYDLTIIIPEQEKLYEEYNEKIKTLKG